MRRFAIVLLGGLVLVLGGCRLSRRIVKITPPPQPPLQELDNHLDYVDPDDGRSTFVIGSGGNR